MTNRFLPKALFASVSFGLLVSAAGAADLPSRKAPPAPAPQLGLDRWMPTASIPSDGSLSWTGFYLGGFAGGVFSQNDIKTSGTAGYAGVTLPGSVSLKPHVATFGGLAGYNYSFDSFVVGAEGEFGYAKASRSATFTVASDATLANVKDEDTYVGRARARAGYAVLPQLLLFGAGGGSTTNDKLSLASTAGKASNASASKQLYGWNIGAGAEYALTDHILLRADYVHDQYAKKTIGFVGSSVWADRSVELKQDTARAAVEYKF